MNKKRILKNIFWKIPLPPALKENLRIKYAQKKFEAEAKAQDVVDCIDDDGEVREYSKYILGSVTRKNNKYRAYETHEDSKESATLIAYYLTQYSPDKHNDEWWGRGTTEWNNVSKAVPQFVGHRQPRLPGELGFYDLRIKDNMVRQIEMAKNYGIDVFSFYYYWFAGERILENALNMFLDDKSLDMPFMFCWANENWTKRFSGTDEGILIGMENSEHNYKQFIHEVIPYFSDPRYFCVDNRIALQIYRPSLIPNVSEIIKYWREQTKQTCGKDLYLFACQAGSGFDWCAKGFDAENEWMQGSIKQKARDITSNVKYINKRFSGQVYDYKDMVENRKYFIKENRKRKVYPAVMPSWDNTARRNNKGIIWHGSTPDLYKKWLLDVIEEVNTRTNIDKPIVFINAWNEWGEGAYLEPDKDYGFAYLQATWEAKNAVKEKRG